MEWQANSLQFPFVGNAVGAKDAVRPRPDRRSSAFDIGLFEDKKGQAAEQRCKYGTHHEENPHIHLSQRLLADSAHSRNHQGVGLSLIHILS